MTTIKQLLQTSPSRSNELFARLLDTSESAVKTRQRLLDELKEELALLAQLEEQHLFPVLRKHKEMRDVVRDAIEDNKQTKRLLAEIEEVPVNSEDFAGKVANLRKVFQQHVRDDKKELLPAIVKVLSNEEAQDVADNIVAGKADVEQARRAESDERRAEERRTRKPLDRTEEATQATSRIVTAGAETLERAARETMRAVERGGDEVVPLFGLAAEQTARVAERASDGAHAMAECGESLRQGLWAISREWSELVQARLQSNLDDMIEVAQARTLPELVAAQGSLIRHNMEMMVENSQRLFRSSMRVAENMRQPFADGPRQEEGTGESAPSGKRRTA
jgi:hypothetical protein